MYDVVYPITDNIHINIRFPPVAGRTVNPKYNRIVVAKNIIVLIAIKKLILFMCVLLIIVNNECIL